MQISFNFTAELMAQLLSVAGVDQRWLRGFRNNNVSYRQIALRLLGGFNSAPRLKSRGITW
jgi:hypothetical protein